MRAQTRMNLENNILNEKNQPDSVIIWLHSSKMFWVGKSRETENELGVSRDERSDWLLTGIRFLQQMIKISQWGWLYYSINIALI